MFYLTDFEEIDEGYVAFGGNPKGGKITGKGTIRTGKLDLKNVYFTLLPQIREEIREEFRTGSGSSNA
nr:ribonuclease H-like domain-containing protein [Tanacetum cinerariifolium]